MSNIHNTGFSSVLKNFFLTLALTAACMAGVLIWNYVRIRPASAYTDQGVHRFEPYEVLPVQVKNTSGTGRSRRMHPTKTIYLLYYRATDGSGYRWSKEVPSKTYGRKRIEEGAPVERRVLSVTGENAYISVEAHLSAESYTRGLRRKYLLFFSVCILYLAGYGCFRLLKKKG